MGLIQFPGSADVRGGIGKTSLLGKPVFHFAAQNLINPYGRSIGSFSGTTPKWGISSWGNGFDSSGTAGDRVTWGYSQALDLAGPEPFSILWSTTVSGFWSTGGTVNLSLARRTSGGTTGEWYFENYDTGEFKFVYRRVGASLVDVAWPSSTLPTSGRLVLLLVREITDATGGMYRLYCNGVNLGTKDLTGGLSANRLEGGGSNGFEIGSTASLATRGVKGITSLVHIARGRIPTVAEGIALTKDPAGTLFPHRRIWVPVSAAPGALLGGATVTDLTSSSFRPRVNIISLPS